MLPSDDKQDVSVSLSHGLTDVPDGAAVEASAIIDGVPQSLVITRVADVLTAFRNICPHAGRRLDWAPGKFLIDQGRLVCAVHGATFELDTGTCLSGPCKGAALAVLAMPWRLDHGV